MKYRAAHAPPATYLCASVSHDALRRMSVYTLPAAVSLNEETAYEYYEYCLVFNVFSIINIKTVCIILMLFCGVLVELNQYVLNKDVLSMPLDQHQSVSPKNARLSVSQHKLDIILFNFVLPHSRVHSILCTDCQ